MNKILINLFFFIIICFIILISILSTIGVETNKFNNIISDKSSESQNINLDLKTIKFKLDLRELSLFLETKNPRIIYRQISVPAENIKVYVDFLSLFTSKPKIEKTSLVLKELDIEQVKKLSIGIKPSNFRSLLNNKIKEGKVIIEIENRTNKQLSIINLIIDTPFNYKINASIKKNFDGLKISKKQIQYLVQDLKQQIKKTSDNIKINHILINEVSMDGKKIDFLPIDMYCDDLIFTLEFICFPKSLIYSLENFFKSHQIKSNSILCANYVESFLNNGFETTYEAAIALNNDYNYNEVSIIPKKMTKMGFFERLFHIFS